MQRKYTEVVFVVYDKKRKGFVRNFNIGRDCLNGVTKNFQNAKIFNDKQEAKRLIRRFYVRTEQIVRIDRLEAKLPSVPEYSIDDFKICKLTRNYILN